MGSIQADHSRSRPESFVGLIGGHGAVTQAIRAAAASGDSGELVLRRGTLTGRVFLVQGAVAWAHCVGVHRFLVHHLAEAHELDLRELRELLKICREEGRQFGDYVVDLGLVSEVAMRGSLAEHFRAQMGVLGSARDELRSLFLPVQRSFHSRFIFDVDELWPEAEAAAASSTGPRMAPASFRARLDAAIGIDGAATCTVIDATTGDVVDARAGQEGAAGASFGDARALALWRAASFLDADEQGRPRDVFVAGRQGYHLVQAVGSGPVRHIVHLTVDGGTGNLAFARLRLRELFR